MKVLMKIGINLWIGMHVWETLKLFIYSYTNADSLYNLEIYVDYK